MKKVLIIEDDVAIIEIVEIILLDAGYAVIKINRQIALKEIAGINPSLIIIDFILYFGLGSDLCMAIKNNDSTKHIPVILYSASTKAEKLAMDSGADAFIPKPFDIDVLTGMVNKLTKNLD